MSDESEWIHRAQTAEASLVTYKAAIEPALEKVKAFKANFGVRERSDGTIIIDYDKFLTALGIEGAAELRRISDEKYPALGRMTTPAPAKAVETTHGLPLQPGDVVKGSDGTVGEFVAYGTDGRPRFRVRPTAPVAAAPPAPRQKREYRKRPAGSKQWSRPQRD